MAEFPRKEVVEDFDPNYGWTEDSNSHHLLIDLPGFEKHQIKINVDNGRLKVSGKRLVQENIYEKFENIFEVPENSDLALGGIQANFDGEILIITIPKHEVEEPELASLKGKEDAGTEPEPDTAKDQNVVPKQEAVARTEPEPDSVKNAEARTEPELPDDAEARTKHEPDSVKDKIVVPRHEVEEEKQLEPAGKKDEGVSKHEEEEKESKPSGIKDPSVVLKHEVEEKKESEPIGVKSQGVNGSTKENIHEKPSDNAKVTKGDNALGAGPKVCQSKEAGSHGDAIVCSPKRTARRQEGEPGYLRSVVETLSENKGIIAMTAIVAFALGMFISMKIQGREKKAP